MSAAAHSVHADAFSDGATESSPSGWEAWSVIDFDCLCRYGWSAEPQGISRRKLTGFWPPIFYYFLNKFLLCDSFTPESIKIDFSVTKYCRLHRSQHCVACLANAFVTHNQMRLCRFGPLHRSFQLLFIIHQWHSVQNWIDWRRSSTVPVCVTKYFAKATNKSGQWKRPKYGLYSNDCETRSIRPILESVEQYRT